MHGCRWRAALKVAAVVGKYGWVQAGMQQVARHPTLGENVKVCTRLRFHCLVCLGAAFTVRASSDLNS